MAHQTVIDIEVRTCSAEGALAEWDPDFFEAWHQANEQCQNMNQLIGLNKYSNVDPYRMVKSEVLWWDDPRAVIRFTFATGLPGDIHD